MLQKIMPMVRRFRASGGHERRHAERIELMSPFIVAATFDDVHRHVCIARNIGIGGALLEFQTESELSDVAQGFRCVLNDMMPDGYRTMTDVRCSVEWQYRKFVGVAFSSPFFRDHDDLMGWLKRVRVSYRLVEDDE